MEKSLQLANFSRSFAMYTSTVRRLEVESTSQNSSIS